jgi:hypothetical protein
VKPKSSKKSNDLDFIKIFSSDPQVQAFTRHLCEVSSANIYDKGQELSTFCTEILSECLNENKPEAIQIYLALYQVQRSLEQISETNLWNLKLVLEYYHTRKMMKSNTIDEEDKKPDEDSTLIKREYLEVLKSKLNQYFEISLINIEQVNNTTVQMNQYFAQLLRAYLTNSAFLESGKPGNEENNKISLHYLSSWLIYHELPDRYTIENIMSCSRDLEANLKHLDDIENSENSRNRITSNDVILQVLSTLWPYISIDSLKVIQNCCST